MTKKEMYIELLNLKVVNENAELVAALNHELELLQRRANVPKKPNKKQQANAELLAGILSEMAIDKPYTNNEMLKELGACAGLSSQKLNALLSRGVKENKIVRTVEKRVAYFTKKGVNARDFNR